MNLSELVIDLYTNIFFIIKKVSKQHNISASQLLCLHVIPSEGIAQSELAEILCLDLSTLSRNLDKLIVKQLVIKKVALFDSRKQSVSLTEDGEKLYLNTLNDLSSSLNSLHGFSHSYDIESIINHLTQFNWLLYKQRH